MRQWALSEKYCNSQLPDTHPFVASRAYLSNVCSDYIYKYNRSINMLNKQKFFVVTQISQ